MRRPSIVNGLAYWPVWHAPLALLFEQWMFGTPSFVQYHYAVAWRDQPWAFSLSIALLSARFLAGYLILAITADIVLRPLLKNPLARWGIFTIGSGVALHWIFHEQPGASSLFAVPQFPKFFLVAGFAIALSALKLGKHSPRSIPKAHWLTLAIGVIFVCSTRPHAWTRNPSGMSGTGQSIVLFGIDGVPREIFVETDGENFVAPRFMKESRSEMVEYSSAYSVTNSTYSSWHSILSGTHPIHSGVDTLYPRERKPETPWLPRTLREKGYRTVFMTDCGATSYFDTSQAWEDIYQSDQGVFGCGRALLSSAHPLLYLFDSNAFFPETGSFCSSLYRPKSFFENVARTRAELSSDNRPYFLAVHSCLPHNVLTQHVPAFDSNLRSNLPRQKHFSQQKKNLMMSIRWFDELLHPILRSIQSDRNPPAFVLFSDHGARIPSYTHAVGLPMNRYQYHVPLFVRLPKPQAQTRVEPVPLTSLYEGLLSLAQNETSALESIDPIPLISAVPIPFGQKPLLLQAFRETEIDPQGVQRFSSAWETRFRSPRPVAFVSGSYRLVLNGVHRRLYDEREDPANERDLSAEYPEIVESILNKACEASWIPNCEKSFTVSRPHSQSSLLN